MASFRNCYMLTKSDKGTHIDSSCNQQLSISVKAVVNEDTLLLMTFPCAQCASKSLVCILSSLIRRKTFFEKGVLKKP